MNTKSMTREEKKELLKTLYLSDFEIVKEVINELASELELSNGLDIPENERRELDKIVNAHFMEYADVFKALA